MCLGDGRGIDNANPRFRIHAGKVLRGRPHLLLVRLLLVIAGMPFRRIGKITNLRERECRSAARHVSRRVGPGGLVVANFQARRRMTFDTDCYSVRDNRY